MHYANNIKSMKQQDTEWEKICEKHKFNKGHVSKIYKKNLKT